MIMGGRRRCGIGSRAAAFAAAAAAAWAALAAGCPGAGPPTEAPAGAPLIRLRLEALDGGWIDTARYRGRVVVLHLFDTDSPAAPIDVDQLAALSRGEPRRVRVIGVALDPEGFPIVSAWRGALDVPYLLGLAGEAIRAGRSPLGRIRVVPTTLILDRRGALVHRIERPLGDGELARLVAPLVR